ncbi:hypothetical protein G6L37_18700 [Agrobacterium rubi]|uniref:hypothetical protein n=1 Tax=Agrobacterium rubi TaxID=28099 RepID=UPI001573B0D1|nr:hypothetical protein [Agrobacterium rubi]NTF08202.1 hypothetical protein [Agrobacterium rubi]NTF20430.1 hypothetical protein [Agrobacterium rubi]NTF27401.1 hypothetical protein [Agrobacterium rubi]
MLFIDTNHPIYQPLWVRLLIVGLCAGWAIIEFINHEIFWATLIGGIAAYSAYVLLITFKPAPVKTEESAATPPDDA